MTPAQLTQSIQQEAARLGFALCGVCPAVTPPGYSRFLEWLEAGYAGQMHYLEERQEAYRHPAGVLPPVVSVVMLALDYRTADPQPAQAGQGRIARYAWGERDYHDLVHDRLKQLKSAVQDSQPEAQVRGVVDTAPLLEREFAQLAGLGWIGKNTLLLNRRRGSFFFLAALLLDQELVYDPPHASQHCGTCTACLDACPTNAFVQPGVLDANRCISYLTIEHRTAIPEPLRSGMGDWLLGCDVCQDVCPWNRMSPVSPEPGLQPRREQNPIPLRELFELDDAGFRARFRKTPLWRPRRRGLLRNAAIVLGNRPAPQNVPALRRGLNDEESLVRGASAWALGQHAAEAVREPLRVRLSHEPCAEVRVEIEQALSRLDPDPMSAANRS